MLKIIRLLPDHDLYTIKGFGIPEDKILVGSFVDATRYLAKLGVPQTELSLAEEIFKVCPDHNAVEFGVMRLSVICSLLVDTSSILTAIGLPADCAYFAEGVRSCA